MAHIAIIGTGSMARELGTGWAKSGHKIVYGSRSPEKPRPELPSADVRDYAAAASAGEIVVIAIPFPDVAPFARDHRDALAGKTIIDISNPFDHLAGNERAAAEYTADALGSTEGLVAAFKDNFAATINTSLPADGQRPDVKLAGDDEEAKARVAELAADLNHRVIDCGPLHNARYIDAMVSLMLIIDQKYEDFTMRTGWKFFGLSFN